MLRSGALARYASELAVTGLTFNPTILGHAMAAGSDYDSSLARLVGAGVTDAQDLVYALALEDCSGRNGSARPTWTATYRWKSPRTSPTLRAQDFGGRVLPAAEEAAHRLPANSLSRRRWMS